LGLEYSLSQRGNGTQNFAAQNFHASKIQAKLEFLHIPIFPWEKLANAEIVEAKQGKVSD